MSKLILFYAASLISICVVSYAEEIYIPLQIDIEMQFVEYKLSDIEPFSQMGAVDVDILVDMWKAKKGKLVASPKVTTQSGCEAMVKGVKEVIYPTDIYADYPSMDSNTNCTFHINTVAVVPSGFETRDVGVILTVLPEISADVHNQIMLTFTAELCHDTEWKTYKAAYTDVKGKSREVSIEQPFFKTQTISTMLYLRAGERVLAGGGMNGVKEGMVIYAFITARLVDSSGKVIEESKKK